MTAEPTGRWRWRLLAAGTAATLAAAVILWCLRDGDTPERRESAGQLDVGSIDAREEGRSPEAATSPEPRDPFAIENDASAEIELPGWPGWPLPKGTTVTPAIFCEGATAAHLFIRNPRCSVEESRADIERNKQKPFAEFGSVMERSRAARCIVRVTSSVAKARVRLDPEAGERCIGAAVDTAFDDIPSPFDTAACNGYILGLQRIGERCTEPWECIEGLACVGFTRATDGRCKALPPLGAACGNGEPDRNIPFDVGDRPACASGARCPPWGGTCQRAKRSGERCKEDWDCLDELACRAGTCSSKERVAAGGACLANAECARNLYCAGTDYSKVPGVCTEKRAAGAPCTDDSECRGHCELDKTTRARACVVWCQSG